MIELSDHTEKEKEHFVKHCAQMKYLETCGSVLALDKVDAVMSDIRDNAQFKHGDEYRGLCGVLSFSGL
ncbi:hypothetical protein LTR85_011096 [Meristemomyces frigidus]|nr:hypothetical protein LTR85_011096 [Meristemomyces frigidus]